MKGKTNATRLKGFVAAQKQLQVNEAIDALITVLEQDPKDARLCYNIGMVREDLKRYLQTL